jgi:hypothetical protein
VVLVSEAQHVAAVVARLTAAGSTALGVAELALMSPKPPHYNEVHAMERNADAYRFGATNGLRPYRLLIRSVGKNYLDAQRERDIVTEALPEGSVLVVNGVESSGLRRDVSDDLINLVDGFYMGVTERVYAISA